MDTRQLAAFCAVVERRSFSQAAERLGVTQPAVSLQVRALEKRLGTQLLDRSRRPERSRSCVPSRFSSARTCKLTAGCVTPSRSAACEKLRRSTTAQNAASWRVSISRTYTNVRPAEAPDGCRIG